MKQQTKLFIITLALCIPLAAMTYALVPTGGYFNPSTGPTGDNREVVPITIGTNPQAKNGGLTIQSPLIVRGDAFFKAETYINGFIAGIRPDAHDSVIAFGDSGHTVSVEATGSVWTKKDMQTNTLMPGGAVCADADGKLVLCSVSNTCPYGSTPSGTGGCIEIPCVVFLTFEGTFRHGRVTYAGSTTIHPALTITATLEGSGNATPSTGNPRDTTFTMPADSTMSYFNGVACGNTIPYNTGTGCGIETTPGFDHGYTSLVFPEYIPEGKICVQQ